MHTVYGLSVDMLSINDGFASRSSQRSGILYHRRSQRNKGLGQTKMDLIRVGIELAQETFYSQPRLIRLLVYNVITMQCHLSFRTSLDQRNLIIVSYLPLL